MRQITDFSQDVFSAVAAPDGSYFVAAGLGGDNGKELIAGTFDGETGKLMFPLAASKEATGPTSDARLVIDPTGRFVGLLRDAAQDRLYNLVEMSSRTELDPIIPLPDTLGPNAELWGRAVPYKGGLQLYRRADATPFVTLGIDVTISSVAQFSRDGRFLAWGNADGSVTVCDLEEVQRRLKEVGLGW